MSIQREVGRAGAGSSQEPIRSRPGPGCDPVGSQPGKVVRCGDPLGSQSRVALEQAGSQSGGALGRPAVQQGAKSGRTVGGVVIQ